MDININLPNMRRMGRPKIPKERKIAEGAAVNASFLAMQKLEEDLTVDSLGDELKITQGNVSQWFSGGTNIPDKTMIWLGGRLRFDPFSLRPSLNEYFYSGLAKSGRDKVVSDVVSHLTTADDSEFKRFSRMIFAYLGDDDSP